MSGVLLYARPNQLAAPETVLSVNKFNLCLDQLVLIVPLILISNYFIYKLSNLNLLNFISLNNNFTIVFFLTVIFYKN